MDRLWDALTLRDRPSPCGWLKDRYGLTGWIVPQSLSDLLASNDAARVDRVMRAKIEVAGLGDEKRRRSGVTNYALDLGGWLVFWTDLEIPPTFF